MFLLGQERRVNNWEGSGKWSDFGGKLEKGLTFQQNAIKELAEESFRVLGVPKKTYIDKLDDSMHIVLQGYICWLLYVPYKDYPKIFLEKRKKNKKKYPKEYYEMSKIKWFTLQEVLKGGKKFRKRFSYVIKKIYGKIE